MVSTPKISIIMPAHNEAKIIGQTLGTLLDEAGQQQLSSGSWQVLVVANGCQDDTAALVRSGWPGVTVVELEQASKTAALRAGAEIAKGSSWVVMDADIDLRAADLALLVQGLEQNDAVAALGEFTPDLRSVSPFVRLFYAAWRHHPYFDGGKFGGCYALTARTGEALLGTMPDVTNDDEWVARQATKLGDVVKTQAKISTKAPQSVRDLIRVRRRVYRGNRELHEIAPKNTQLTTPEASGSSLLQRLAIRPNLWLAGLCYAAVNIIAKLGNVTAQDPKAWEQAKRY